MKKQTLTAIIICSSILITAVIAARLLSPGSYVYTEEYEVDLKESELIARLENFKLNNPRYNVPLEVGLVDGRRDSLDNWFHIYFYYHDTDQIVKTWTRPSGRTTTTVGFVGLNKGLILGNWKFINKDFDSSENSAQKLKFEQQILNQVKEKI
jgi:hypothetical protein